MVTIKYDDLSAAFDFVNFGDPLEQQAFVDLHTGAIHWVSESNPIDKDELPDDLDESDRYLQIPYETDLDLGSRLALRFAERQLPDRYADVEACFRHRGAYRRFKDLLATERCLDAWYAFEAECTERALREWCAAHQIRIAGSDSQPSA